MIDPPAGWPGTATERRLGQALTAGAVAALLVGLAIASPRAMSVDDAKYLGIGSNLLAGAGPVTVFGAFFPFHAPLWPLIVMGPSTWLGLDPLGWAHLLNVISAISVILLAVGLAWPVRPLVGGLAAVVGVGFGYVADLGHGMGLDLPAAALTLAYVVVALRAIARGSIRRALAAGALFAVAFSVKEVALPFAPVPFLAALVVGQPWRPVARAAGAVLLVATPGVAWWFLIYAAETGEVYRLGTPAWTLAPLGLAAAIVGLAGLLVERWAPSAKPSPEAGATEQRTEPAAGGRARRIGWVLTGAWFLALTGFFALSRTTLGQSFLDPDEVLATIRVRFSMLAPLTAFGLAGLAFLAARPPHGQARRATAVLAVATIGGLPLVLLVLSIGELPRHYLAQALVLAGLGAAGWVGLASALAASLDRRTLALAAVGGAILPPVALQAALGRVVEPRLAIVAAIGGLVVLGGLLWIVRRRSGREPAARAGRIVGTAFLAGIVIAAGGAFAVDAYRSSRPSLADDAKRAVIERGAAWIRTHVAAGETVAYGAGFAYETAARVQATHAAVQIREFQDIQFDATAPLGVGRHGDAPADDWIVLVAAPTRTDILYGFAARPLAARIQVADATTWIQTAGDDDRATAGIVEILGAAPGIARRDGWSVDAPDGAYTTTVFSIDRAALVIPTDRLLVSVAALGYLVERLEGIDAAAARQIAIRLLERVVVFPDPAAAADLLGRLAALATG